MTDAEITNLRDLMRAATPGPWAATLPTSSTTI